MAYKMQTRSNLVVGASSAQAWTFDFSDYTEDAFDSPPLCIPYWVNAGATAARYGSVSLNVTSITTTSCTVRAHNDGDGQVQFVLGIGVFRV